MFIPELEKKKTLHDVTVESKVKCSNNLWSNRNYSIMKQDI